MRRREFLSVLGGATTGFPLAARAQQPQRVRRIGALVGGVDSDPEQRLRLTAFQHGLQELGWNEGQNVRIDYRFGGGNFERTRTYAAELVSLTPDVILASTTPPLLAMQQATRTIPIVFAQVADPLSGGFVTNLSRPTGNITGFASTEDSSSGKWLELLKEIVPSISRVLVIGDQTDPSTERRFRVIETAATSLSVQVTGADVRNNIMAEHVIDAFAQQSNGGVIVQPSPSISINREHIIAMVANRRLPAIYWYRHFAVSGGLISYGNDMIDVHRRAALYVARILKGEKPADLPVQQPTKFELVINLRTAKALGLTITREFLLRADEVIE